MHKDDFEEVMDQESGNIEYVEGGLSDSDYEWKSYIDI